METNLQIPSLTLASEYLIDSLSCSSKVFTVILIYGIKIQKSYKVVGGIIHNAASHYSVLIW